MWSSRDSCLPLEEVVGSDPGVAGAVSAAGKEGQSHESGSLAGCAPRVPSVCMAHGGQRAHPVRVCGMRVSMIRAQGGGFRLWVEHEARGRRRPGWSTQTHLRGTRPDNRPALQSR